MLHIEIEDADYQRAATAFLSSLSAGAQRATSAEAAATRDAITGGKYWQNRTGKLAQSFRVEQHPEHLGAVLVSGSKVARFLDAGTKAHAIAPRKKGALRFVSNGRPVFARRVQHPGTAPRNFTAAESAAAEPRLAGRVVSAAESAASSSGLG